MPKYSVPYAQFQLPPTPAFPNGRVARRPVLPIKLVNGTSELNCYAMVDSGADFCAFPLSFARILGLDPLTGVLDRTAGLGSDNVPTYFWNVGIDIQGTTQIEVYAGFTDGLEQWGIGLLGQTGFFDRFAVSFNLNRGIFEFEI